MTWVLLLLTAYVALGLSRLPTQLAVRYAVGVTAVVLTTVRILI